nr:MAG: hypothetical protein [Microvirus sp.]
MNDEISVKNFNVTELAKRRPDEAERQLSGALAKPVGSLDGARRRRFERSTIEFWAQCICDQFDVESVTVRYRRENQRFEPRAIAGARDRDEKRWTYRRLGPSAVDVKSHEARELAARLARNNSSEAG